MKRFLGVILGLLIVISVPIVASAYSCEDILSTKEHILGYDSLFNDINDDGNTNILDILNLKHDIIKEAINVKNH